MGSQLAGEHSGPSAHLAGGRRAPVSPSVDGRDAQGPRVLLSGHGVGYDAVLPRALNELPDQESRLLLTSSCSSNRNASGQPLQSYRLHGGSFHRKGIGRSQAHRAPLCYRARAVQASKVEAELWRPSTEEVSSGPRTRVVMAAWSERATADGHAVATILYEVTATTQARKTGFERPFLCQRQPNFSSSNTRSHQRHESWMSGGEQQGDPRAWPTNGRSAMICFCPL